MKCEKCGNEEKMDAEKVQERIMQLENMFDNL